MTIPKIITVADRIWRVIDVRTDKADNVDAIKRILRETVESYK